MLLIGKSSLILLWFLPINQTFFFWDMIDHLGHSFFFKQQSRLSLLQFVHWSRSVTFWYNFIFITSENWIQQQAKSNGNLWRILNQIMFMSKGASRYTPITLFKTEFCNDLTTFFCWIGLQQNHKTKWEFHSVLWRPSLQVSDFWTKLSTPSSN